MKVVYVFRKKNKNAHSIEELFYTISDEMRKHAEVVEYVCGSRLEIFYDILKLRSLNADIYHVTGDVHYIILLLPHKKTVLTVHDISHYLFGLSGFNRIIFKWLWLTFPLRIAQVVTTISIETRNNLVKHLGMSTERIRVVENCHSTIFRRSPHQFKTTCPVILQVGTKPNKNVPRLIDALVDIPCHLVLIGQLNTELKAKLIERRINYTNHVGLSHAEIYQQYVDSDIVAFVSTVEGFGVPIIEAQACGRPLITSNVAPMCDVAGDGACLVDPLDEGQIRNGIKKIIADSNYRDQIVQCGLRNASRYSPGAIGAQYYDLYRGMTCF